MKFVIHDYHNNNSYPVGSFESHENLVFIPQDGYITTSGLTFFMLPKIATLEERVAIITALHALLQHRFDQGLAAVTCAVSDCADFREFDALFSRVKAIDPAIKTIEIVHEPFRDDDIKRSPHADISIAGINDKEHIKASLVTALTPDDGNANMSHDKRAATQKTLNALYGHALRGERPAQHPFMGVLRKLRDCIPI